MTSISRTSTGASSLRAVRRVKRQSPARAGEHELGPFVLGAPGDTERQGGVGEHAGDQDALSRQEPATR